MATNRTRRTRTTRTRTLQSATSALLLALLAACGSPSPKTNDGGYISGNGGITRLEPGDREELLEVSGDDLDGNPISSKQFLGKVLVINVWGSWCPPCRVEQPILSRLSTELKPDGVEFLGIAIRESAAASKAFTASRNVPYPSIGDADAQLLVFAKSLPAIAVPTTYVIDRQGRVATRLLDKATYSTLKGLIEDVAAEPDPTDG